jgi:DNA-binding transcriptional ArsR family regulator
VTRIIDTQSIISILELTSASGTQSSLWARAGRRGGQSREVCPHRCSCGQEPKNPRPLLSNMSDASVGQVVALFDVSAPAISRHLRVLEDSGLVSRQKQGRVHRLHIEREAMNEALGWIAHWGRFWESRFDALDELLLARDSEAR